MYKMTFKGTYDLKGYVEGEYDYGDDEFDDDLSDLIYFKYKYGNFNQLHLIDPPLNEWVCNLVNLFRKKKLSSYKIDKLQKLGIELNPKFIFVADDVMRRIDCLIHYRKETGGDTPSKYSDNKEHASLAQWLTRQKRAFNGGALDSSVIEALKEVGIVFAPPSEKYKIMGKLAEDQAFKRNMENLYDRLSEMLAKGMPKDFRLKDIKNSPELKQAYRFLEHTILKLRNGTLKVDQENKILDLNISMNGIEFKRLLYRKSKRPVK